MDMEKTLIKFVCIATGAKEEDVDLATDLHGDLKCKSMAIVALCSQIEDEWDVTISFDEANRLNTVSDYLEKIKEEM